MERFRPHLLVLVVVAAIVLAAVFSHGIRLRLFWGAGGFLLGLVCGILLTMEIRHRHELSKTSGENGGARGHHRAG